MMDVVKLVVLGAIVLTVVLAFAAEIMSAKQLRKESKLYERRKNP